MRLLLYTTTLSLMFSNMGRGASDCHSALLPAECDAFRLSGDLKNANAVLFGENHDYNHQTLLCMQALMQLNPAKIFLEDDLRIPEIREKHKKFCGKKSVRCEVWDSLSERDRVADVYIKYYRYKTQTRIEDMVNQLRESFADAQVFNELSRSLNAETPFKKELKKLNIYFEGEDKRLIIQAALQDVVQRYQKTQSFKKTFQEVFNENEKLLSSYLGRPLKFSDRKLISKDVDKVWSELFLLAQTPRDETLKNAVLRQVSQGGVNFFVAGIDHVKNVMAQLKGTRAEEKIAVLEMKSMPALRSSSR
jgi:hypothetical protein